MNTTAMYLIVSTALALSPATKAQRLSDFDFELLVQPGMTIGGHTFTSDTTIDSVVLNDNGDVAFIAHWKDLEEGRKESAVFTSTEVVAYANSWVDHKFILDLKLDSLSIDKIGQVAFEAAYYKDTLEAAALGDYRAVFIDNHLAMTIPAAETPIVLTDDGQLVKKVAPPMYSADETNDFFRRHARNDRGQLLIAVNVSGGFVLILGTPSAEASLSKQ